MIGKAAAALVGLILFSPAADAAFFQGAVNGSVGGGGGNVAFSLPSGSTLKYIATNANGGSDANDGLAPTVGGGHGPWATPNHAMSCGEVIIAGVGNYPALQTWGTVSNCPSTTGGIDGAGGVYFAILLCSGNVGTCQVNHPTGFTYGVDVNANNWAVEGWLSTEGYANGSTGFGFSVEQAHQQMHHTAFINDISAFNASGFTSSTNTGTSLGYDYFACVGCIAQDSAGRNDGFWDAAIDMVAVKNWDTNPGTHIFIAGNYAYNCQQTTGGASDGECYMDDTLDALNYTGQIVHRDNIGAISERFGLQLFYQNISAGNPTIKVYNNSFYGANQGAFTGPDSPGNPGDINIQSTVSSLPWTINIYNNLVKENRAAPSGSPSNINYAFTIGGNYTGVAMGNTGSNPANSQNFMIGLATTCGGPFCNSGPPYSATSFGTSTNLGVNTYADPAFTNMADLVSNRLGTPSCSAFQTTEQCLGYDPGTGTLTTPSFISDFVPTAGGTSGKGYRLSSTTCVASDPDYPTWLKGIVYLHWNGSSLTENSGLVTKPCNL